MERESSEGISLPVAGAGERELAGARLYVVGMPGPGGCGCSGRCQGLNRLVGAARRGVRAASGTQLCEDPFSEGGSAVKLNTALRRKWKLFKRTRCTAPLREARDHSHLYVFQQLNLFVSITWNPPVWAKKICIFF